MIKSKNSGMIRRVEIFVMHMLGKIYFYKVVSISTNLYNLPPHGEMSLNIDNNMSTISVTIDFLLESKRFEKHFI